MLAITFHPDHDELKLTESVAQYQGIWSLHGPNIVKAVEDISGLKFREHTIHAIVFEGVSYSRPLQLRASYEHDIKIGTLIHELCHRLPFKVKGQRGRRMSSLESHKLLFLILYDIWVQLLGKDFADKNVAAERGRGDEYVEAWDWALAMTPGERNKQFRRLLDFS